MGVSALHGALGFFTRIPIKQGHETWQSVVETPTSIVFVGYLIGGLMVIPFLLALPSPTIAILFVVWLYLLTGITHLDGIADVGDALIIHGENADRIEVLKDTTLGVGGILGLVLIVLALVSVAGLLAELSIKVLLLVITAEVCAKFCIILVSAAGTPIHDGLGSTLVHPLSVRDLPLPLLITVPAVLVTFPHPASVVAFFTGIITAGIIVHIARTKFGGVNGDILGATNELVRVVVLHVGVVVWMLY